MEWVPCHIARILVDERQDRHVVTLRADADDRHLGMDIGQHEALAIERALHREPFPRPLTHDLLLRVLEVNHARLLAVRIVREETGTYFAELVLLRADEEEHHVDCRPSDALALLTRCDDAELLIAEALLND